MEAEEEKQKEREEREDVTKKTGGAAFVNFYGNFNRNVAMGGDNKGNQQETDDKDFTKKQRGALSEELGFMDGFERAEGARADEAVSPEGQEDVAEHKEHDKETDSPETQRRNMRKAREEKLTRARARYFERNGIAPQ